MRSCRVWPPVRSSTCRRWTCISRRVSGSPHLRLLIFALVVLSKGLKTVGNFSESRRVRIDCGLLSVPRKMFRILCHKIHPTHKSIVFLVPPSFPAQSRSVRCNLHDPVIADEIP